MFFRRFLFLLLLAACLCNCSIFRGLDYVRGEKSLTINADKIVYEGYRNGSLQLELPLVLDNRSRGEVLVERIELQTTLSGHCLMSLDYEDPFCIEPKSSRRLALPVAIDPLAGALGAIGKKPELCFGGTITVDLGALGHRKFNFGIERKIFRPSNSDLSFEGLSFGKSTLSSLEITMTFRREAGAWEKTDWSRFSGTLWINNLEVGTFFKRDCGGDEDILQIDLSIPTTGAIMLIPLLKQSEKLRVKIDSLYEAESKRMLYRVPYIFESDDLRSPW